MSIAPQPVRAVSLRLPSPLEQLVDDRLDSAGHYFSFSTIGIIRGGEHRPPNPIPASAARHGMTLSYVDRTQ